MKLRLPLYAQILGWFFMNLVLLGVVFLLFVRMQFHVGADWLLTFGAGDRIDALAEGVLSDLRSGGRDQWAGILQRAAEPYGVDLGLVSGDPRGGGIGMTNLPPLIRERVMQRGGGPPGGRPPRRGPPLQGPGERERGPGGRGPLDGFGPPGGGGGGYPKFMARTEDPTRYWVVVRLPIPESPGGRPAPGALVIASASLSGGGLLFDVTPWVSVAGAIVLLSALFWIPFVHGVTRSVSQLTRATEQIAQGQFEVRLGSDRRDELGSLAGSVNRLAGRLSGYVTGQKRFLGDIAHELCAPLARLQMTMGILEQRVDPGVAETLQDAQQEVQEMSLLVNELLSFSKAGLEARESGLQRVELLPLVQRVVDRESPGGEGVTVGVPEGLWCAAHPELLSRALGNLLRNAIRYAGGAGAIT
ncbi:MAG TPA: hypothetical protein DCM86_11930, partial [Verrucomicrobiales bacterium]|nr:hypothetical protein [Verrucomicrobiales bacterium]